MTTSKLPEDVEDRRNEVWRLTSEGATAVQCAELIGITPRTAERYRKKLRERKPWCRKPDTRYYHPFRADRRDPPIACRDHDPELWYPLPGEDAKREEAKAICRSCPVIEKCRQWAIDTREEYGVWGGLDEDERAEVIRRKRRRR